MNTKYLFLIWVLLIGVESVAQDTEVYCKIYNAEAATYYNFKNFQRSGSAENIDIKYHKIILDVEMTSGFLRGRVQTAFVSIEKSVTLVFDLKNDLQVDSVTFRNKTRPFLHVSDLLSIDLQDTIYETQFDSIVVYYRGIPNQGLGYYTRFAHATGPVIATRSQPYGSSWWWPSKQTLNDKIDSLDFVIICDSSYKAASNGVLMEDIITNSGKRISVWKHRYPIVPYLVAFAVSNYRVFEHTLVIRNDTMPIVNYVYPQTFNSAFEDSKVTLPMMVLFDSLFGPYPFRKEQYGHTQFPYGGGMEHQTMSFMGSFNYDLIAHELGHQWFGDMATCRSWRDLWLNEGFATYMNLICYENLKTYNQWQTELKKAMNEVMQMPGGSVYVSDTTRFETLFDQRLTYKKGAMVLHMLRWELGDSIFYKGLRNYLTDTLVAYGFALTQDLQRHLEQVSGRNLTKFFNQWVFGEGYPTYTIIWSQNGNIVTVEVSQTTSHPSVGFYEMHLPIKFIGSNTDTLLVLPNVQNGQVFTFQLPFDANEVQFDPETKILAKSSVFKRQAEKAPFLIVFPNPATNNLSVILKDDETNMYEVISVTGETVKKVYLSTKIARGEVLSIPFEESVGIYFLKLHGDQGIYVHKIVIQ